jgi:hypothetical protein
MGDPIQDILTEVFAPKTETQSETATIETETAETKTEEVIETATEEGEGNSANDSTLTEVSDEVKTETDTTTTTETSAETAQISPLDSLFQKLGVKDENEISAKFDELRAEREKKTLGRLIDSLSEKGIDPITAVTFSKLDIDKLSDVDKIAWDYKMKYPSLTEEGIAALIEKEYGDETDVAGRAKMTIDAAKAAQS